MGKGKKLLPTTKSDKGKQPMKKHPLIHTEPLSGEPSEPLFTSQDDRQFFGNPPGDSDHSDNSEEEEMLMDRSPEPPSGQDILDDDELTQTQTQTQQESTQESTQETQVDEFDADIEEEEQQVDEPPPSTSSSTQQQAKKKRREAPAAPAAKQRRTYYHIPQDKEMDLAEWYREQEFLYNKKLRAYRDRDRKARAWEDKAASLDIEGEYQNHVYASID